MNLVGEVSKVAVCTRCDGYVLVCHKDRLTKNIEKEFTELTNEGFSVLLETIKETQVREFSEYDECVAKLCVK